LDPHIILNLPRRYRSLLPVRADWILNTDSEQGGTNSDFYFGKDLASAAEFDNVTNETGASIMRRLSVMLNVMYNEHQNDYMDHIRAWRKYSKDDTFQFPEWPTFEEWIGRPKGVPDAHAYRTQAEEAIYNAGSAGNSTRYDYRERQLQNVAVTDAFSIDHTHDTAKNFKDKAINGIFDAAVGDYIDPILAVCTDGTGMEEVCNTP
jgi:hypothetical protein